MGGFLKITKNTAAFGIIDKMDGRRNISIKNSFPNRDSLFSIHCRIYYAN